MCMPPFCLVLLQYRGSVTICTVYNMVESILFIPMRFVQRKYELELVSKRFTKLFWSLFTLMAPRPNYPCLPNCIPYVGRRQHVGHHAHGR